METVEQWTGTAELSGRHDHAGGAQRDMKVLTAAQMREVDRRTIEMGVPGVVLMENAGHPRGGVSGREFSPLAEQRVVVLCGKGNNGGDGMVVARQLFTRYRPQRSMWCWWPRPGELKGEAAANYRMLESVGCPVLREFPADARRHPVIDALLGTGLTGRPGRMLDGIREINTDFPWRKIVAVDIPSGLASDSGEPAGRNRYTRITP